ncbi:MAG: hypothetical protein H6546_02755 [Chitinophagales bacterium]|nr:hypothetical protein [Chitinophagales bacterium]
MSIIKIPKLIIELVGEDSTPYRKDPTDSCWDLRARKIEVVREGLICVHLGIKVQPPPGYDVRLYPRSSLSKTGWVLGNSLGIIDQKYRDEMLAYFVCVPKGIQTLEGYNKELVTTVVEGVSLAATPFPYSLGDRVIQMEMRKKLDYDIVIDQVDMTDNRGGGFGSTGMK